MTRTLVALFGARAAASVAQAVMLLLLAREAGPSTFGTVSSIVGLGMFLSVVCDLGAGTYVLKLRAVDPSDPRIRTCLRITNVGAISIVGILLVSYLMYFQASVSIWDFLPIAVWSALERWAESWVAILIADRREWMAALTIVIRRVLPLGLQIAALAAGADALISFGVPLVVGGVVGLAITVLALRGGITGIAAPFSAVFSRSRHFWAATSSSQSRELEPLLVQVVAGPAAAGFYSLGYRLGRPVQLLAVSTAQSLLPHIARGTTSLARRAIVWLLVFGVVLTVIGGALWPLVPWLVDLLAGPGFESAVDPTRFVILFVGLASICFPLGSVLQGAGYEKFVGQLGITIAVISCIACAVGAWNAGAVGAAIAVGASYGVKFIALGCYGLAKLDKTSNRELAGQTSVS